MRNAERIYHYTEAHGLQGILEGDVAIWLTDAQYLNDAQEQQFGRDRLVTALDARRNDLRRVLDDPTAQVGGETEQLTELEVILGLLRPTHEDRFPPGNAYVACFCEEGDLLSQWRGYARGGGYAIGFDVQKLESLPSLPLTYDNSADPSRLIGVYTSTYDPFEDALPQPQLVKVEYGEAAADRFADEINSQIAQQPHGHSSEVAFVQFLGRVLPGLARIKHAAFEEEKEWRIVAIADTLSDQIAFRPGPYGLLPYYKLQLPTDAVREVIVGPGPHSALRVESVRRLLAAAGKQHVRVRPSSAPFRP